MIDQILIELRAIGLILIALIPVAVMFGIWILYLIGRHMVGWHDWWR